MRSNLFYMLVLSIILAACNMGRKYQRPDLVLPSAFSDTAFADTSSIADVHWQDFFQDTTLRQLIRTGLANNHDLLVAVKRIDIAGRQLQQARALWQPALDVKAGMQYNRPSDNSLNGLSANNFLGKSHIENYLLSANLSWEIDIWGKISGRQEIARTEYLRTQEAARAVHTSLVAGIAQGYFNLLMLDTQLSIAKQNLALTDSFLTATRLLKDAGNVNLLAVQQAESQYHATAALVPQLEQSIILQENALQVLTGQLPGHVERNGQLTDIRLPGKLSTGVPLAMVGRRPEVRAAELSLRSAHASIGVARANMYPAINLTAGAGLESFKSGNWLSVPGSLFGVAAGTIVQPVLQRRQLKTQLEVAKAEAEIATIQFRQSVLTATGEVMDALQSTEKLHSQEEILLKQNKTLTDAVANAQLLFRSDMANYLEVITAQGDALQAQLRLSVVQRDRLQAVVQLYRALGGGL